MERATGPGLTVNGVTADFAAETLRDRQGRPVPLRPQAFAVLRYLTPAALAKIAEPRGLPECLARADAGER